MKRLLTIVAFLLTVGMAIAQNRPAPTTQEEYNYLTKGYKIQVESGLDVKKGYRFEDAYTHTIEGKKHTHEFKYLIREASNEIAATLIIIKIADWAGSVTKYLCLPNDSNSPLNSEYFKTIPQNSIESLEFIKAYTAFTQNNITLKK